MLKLFVNGETCFAIIVGLTRFLFFLVAPNSIMHEAVLGTSNLSGTQTNAFSNHSNLSSACGKFVLLNQHEYHYFKRINGCWSLITSIIARLGAGLCFQAFVN